MGSDFRIRCDLHEVDGPELWRKAGGRILLVPSGEHPFDHDEFATRAQLDWAEFLIEHEFCGQMRLALK